MTAVAARSVFSPVLLPVHRPRPNRLLKYSNRTALSPYRFTSLAPISSEWPGFELHHPYVAYRLRTEADRGRGRQSLPAVGEIDTGEVANGSGPQPVIGTVLSDPGQTPT